MRTHMGRSFKAVQRIGFKSELVTRLKGRIAELEAENAILLKELAWRFYPEGAEITDDMREAVRQLVTSGKFQRAKNNTTEIPVCYNCALQLKTVCDCKNGGETVNMKTRPFQIGHIITQPVLKVVTLITCEDPSCGKEFDETTATTITVLGDVEMTICPECRKWWKKHDEFHTEIVTGIRRAALGEVQP